MQNTLWNRWRAVSVPVVVIALTIAGLPTYGCGQQTVSASGAKADLDSLMATASGSGGGEEDECPIIPEPPPEECNPEPPPDDGCGSGSGSGSGDGCGGGEGNDGGDTDDVTPMALGIGAECMDICMGGAQPQNPLFSCGACQAICRTLQTGGCNGFFRSCLAIGRCGPGGRNAAVYCMSMYNMLCSGV